jgi:hypothetical protein
MGNWFWDGSMLPFLNDVVFKPFVRLYYEIQSKNSYLVMFPWPCLQLLCRILLFRLTLWRNTEGAYFAMLQGSWERNELVVCETDGLHDVKTATEQCVMESLPNIW